MTAHHARHPRAPGAGRRAGGRRRLRLEAQRLRRGAARASPWPASTACPCAGPRSAPRTRRPPSRAAGQIQDIELAADADGKLTAVRVNLLADMGAYLQLVTPGHPAARRVPLPRRLRRAPAYSFTLHVGVHQHDADRRLPRRRPARGHLRHRAGHGRAGRQGRRRPGRDPPAQLHPDRAVPVHRVTGLVYDSGDYDGAADEGRSSWSATTALRAEQAARRTCRARRSTSASASRPTSRCAAWRRAGCWRRSTTRPAAGRPPRCGCCPPARCRSSPAPRRTARATRPSWSMIVADKLGVDARRRRGAALRHRDQPARPGHLRLAVAGRRRHRHRHGRRQGDRQGPARSPPTSWRRPRTTSSSSTGTFTVRGTPDKAMPLAGDRVRGVHRPRPARRHGAEPRGPASPTTRPTSRSRSAPTSAWSRSTRRPAASTCCKYVAVDDCGNQINPLIVEGQVHGGIVQGVAQALFEEAVYDDDGNLTHVARSPTTWCRRPPRCRPSPSTTPSRPSPTNPLGRQGHRRGGHHRRRARGHERRRRRAVAARHHRRRHARLAAADGVARPIQSRCQHGGAQ